MKALVVAPLLLLVGFTAGTAFAFDDKGMSFAGDSAMTLVLTPARLSQPQSQVPASVTIIDRELIEATGAREIYQLLQLVPGMSAIKVDGNVPTVSYHGTQSRDVRRLQVMIDGRSQYLPGLSRVLWNDFPLEIEDIERIEVTRGPASAAYGANAFQGVINIISRHPQDVSGATVAVRSGNNGVQDWRVSSTGGEGAVSSRITVASRDDDGYSVPYAGEPRRDEKSIQTINSRTHIEVSQRDSLELLAGGSRRSLGLSTEQSDFGQYTDFIELPENRSDEAFAQLRWKRQVSDRQQVKVQLYTQYKRTEDSLAGCFTIPDVGLPPAAGGLLFSKELRDLFEENNRNWADTESAFTGIFSAGPQTPVEASVLARFNTLAGSGLGAPCGQLNLGIIEKRHDLEIENTIQLTATSRLLLGANLRLDQGESEVYVSEDVSNFSQSLFGNLEVQLAPPLFLNLGGYWEHDQLNGSYFNPRGAVIYQFLPSQSLRLVYAEALRTMDIYEKRADIHILPKHLSGGYGTDPVANLGWATPELFPTQKSDGRLKPESIRSTELGYYARVSSLEWDLRVFREQLDSLMSESLGPLKFQPSNDGSINIQGAEMQLSWRLHPRHLLRVTGSRISTKAEHPDAVLVRTEQTLAAENLASALWRFDMNQNWMLAANWHLADSWGRRNQNKYERADFHIAFRTRLPHSTLEVSALVQHLLTDDPIVRHYNLYKEDNLYWLAAAVSF